MMLYIAFDLLRSKRALAISSFLVLAQCSAEITPPVEDITPNQVLQSAEITDTNMEVTFRSDIDSNTGPGLTCNTIIRGERVTFTTPAILNVAHNSAGWPRIVGTECSDGTTTIKIATEAFAPANLVVLTTLGSNNVLFYDDQRRLVSIIDRSGNSNVGMNGWQQLREELGY